MTYRVSTAFIRRQPRFVDVACDWAAQMANVTIKRMGRFGGYVAQQYTLGRHSPSARRLQAVLSKHEGTYRRTVADPRPASRYCIERERHGRD